MYIYKEVAGSALASSMRLRWLIRYGESHEGSWCSCKAICCAASWIGNCSFHNSLYSSVAERQSCKLKVLGSIPSGGYNGVSAAKDR